VSSQEEKDFSEYADLKYKITGNLVDFKKICNKQGRDADSEIADCVHEAVND